MEARKNRRPWLVGFASTSAARRRPRRRSVVLAMVGTLLTGVLVAVGADAPALASQLVPALNIKYAPNPPLMVQPVYSPLVQVQLALQQGETRRLFASVDAYSTTVTVATEFATSVHCVDATHPTVEIGYRGVAAANYVPGNTYLSPQTLFTAPATATYICALEAYAERSGIYVNPGDTYLEWDGGNVAPAGYLNSPPCGDPYPHPDWPCTYLGQPTDGTPGISQAYLLDATGTDPAQGWTASPNATTIDAMGTLGLSTCYKSSSCKICPTPDTCNNKYVTERSGSATVATRMEVIQRNASGGICNITSTDTYTNTISASVHHYGMPYSLFDVPVLASCGSRVFSARIFVRLVSGDNVKIDTSLPDANGMTGETRTHISMANSTLTAPMPYVIGWDRNDATSAVQALGLTVLPDLVGGGGQCTLATRGQVLQSTPAAGTLVPLGGYVTLTICNPATTVMPNLIGDPDWGHTVAAAGLFEDYSFMTDSHAIGTVIGQSIPVGQLTLQGTWIHLTLSSGPAPTVVPVGQDWFEIFAPLINAASNTLCTDVPGGTSSSGALLQLWRCHGYAYNGAPQRWQFVNLGASQYNGRTNYQIRNTGNNLCLLLANDSGTPGTRIAQGSCSSGVSTVWQILDQSTGNITNGSAYQFELRNAWYPLCVAAANSSDYNGTALTTTACTVGGTQTNTFALG